MTKYKPPSSREELENRYTNGERYFPECDLYELDLSGIKLDGSLFEIHSWFFGCNFEGASLRGVSFRECNVKCASFRNANLSGASFEGAAIESADFRGANLEGVKVVGATSYGYTLEAEDELPQ